MRIKIIQILYAFYKGDGKSLPVAEKELFHVFERTYDLYFHLLLLSVELVNYASGVIDSRRHKFRPTEDDLKPNTTFIDNLFVKNLAGNSEFQKIIAERKISWKNSREALKDIFDELAVTEIYREYMQKPSFGLESDKKFWRQVYMEFIPESTALEAALEEQSIYWVDGLDITASFIVKSIRNIKRKDDSKPLFLPMFRHDDDWDFARKLFRNTIENEQEYKQIIGSSTSNWELDRIADMDILIMQTALAEILTFPAIPVNVTLNEYINLAKMYSTHKSGIFINGILDNAIKQLQSENKLIKVVIPDDI